MCIVITTSYILKCSSYNNIPKCHIKWLLSASSATVTLFSLMVWIITEVEEYPTWLTKYIVIYGLDLTHISYVTQLGGTECCLVLNWINIQRLVNLFKH